MSTNNESNNELTAPPRGRTALVMIALLAVLGLVAACGSQHVTGGQPSAKNATVPAAPLALSSLTGPQPVPGGPAHVTGVLPAPRSTDAAAYGLSVGPATQQQVTALARALGITATPVHGSDGWTATSPAGLVLHVADTAGRAWTVGTKNGTFAPMPMPMPVPDATPGDTGTDPPPAVGRAVQLAKSVLGKVLAATGRTGDPVAVSGSWRGATASADHQVDGLLAVGFGTQVSVSGHGWVLAGSGWLGTATARGRYPIISAAAALKRLPQGGGGMHPDYCVRTDQGAACAGQPRTVTSARLGLLLAHDSHGSALLVPAWLFTVRGQSAPLAVVAVADSQLRAPSPSPSR